MGQVGEDCGGDLPPNVGKGVAVEEKEGSAAMAVPQERYDFVEGEKGVSLGLPFACCRRLSLSIKAVLRASSCTRSSVEADDKLPAPVFDKSGSGL